jgi:predicted O-linked N-acetylglucosamine transferase (SPINDLY family)
LEPDVLIDLGGHTADNQPGLLNFRIAPLQITYLGFYGPSYGNECDWWVLDREIAKRVDSSYLGAESIWSLPCPSLCFDPVVHGLPSPDQISYTQSSSPVFGSFNHTRKLTQQCLSRFYSVLSEFPESKLLFRAHSFFDPQIRRWFMSKLVQSGVSPHQLLAIPYAPTPFEGYCDYGRIHIHFDTFPVCGTTTTLDSLAMGIPVLTSPNRLYAGAISAAIIEHAGFTEWIAENPCELPQKASELFARYRTADSRRGLAQHIRSSPLCDTFNTPRIFSEQLIEMMKYSSLKR